MTDAVGAAKGGTASRRAAAIIRARLITRVGKLGGAQDRMADFRRRLTPAF